LGKVPKADQSLQKIFFDQPCHHRSSRCHIEFGKNPAQMGGNCPRTDIQNIADTFVGQALGDKFRDRKFTRA